MRRRSPVPGAAIEKGAEIAWSPRSQAGSPARSPGRPLRGGSRARRRGPRAEPRAFSPGGVIFNSPLGSKATGRLCFVPLASKRDRGNAREPELSDDCLRPLRRPKPTHEQVLLVVWGARSRAPAPARAGSACASPRASTAWRRLRRSASAPPTGRLGLWSAACAAAGARTTARRVG
jgi:hypothetical protein